MSKRGENITKRKDGRWEARYIKYYKNGNAKSRMTYEESIAAIKIAVDCGICCFANVVVSDENIEQLDLLGDYLSRIGVQGIDLLRPVQSYDGKYVPKISNTTLEILSKVTDYIESKSFTVHDVITLGNYGSSNSRT